MTALRVSPRDHIRSSLESLRCCRFHELFGPDRIQPAESGQLLIEPALSDKWILHGLDEARQKAMRSQRRKSLIIQTTFFLTWPRQKEMVLPMWTPQQASETAAKAG